MGDLAIQFGLALGCILLSKHSFHCNSPFFASNGQTIIVPTFTKVTEYLCSGFFFFRQNSTFSSAIFDGIFLNIIRKVLLS